MDPNSTNQWWSKWVWFIKPGREIPRSTREVQANLARFGRKAFGAASQMRVRRLLGGYLVEVLTEGHPVHDKQYVEYMDGNWKKFFMIGFGLGTTSRLSAKLMAGRRQDGTPAEQMLIMPSINLLKEVRNNG